MCVRTPHSFPRITQLRAVSTERTALTSAGERVIRRGICFQLDMRPVSFLHTMALAQANAHSSTPFSSCSPRPVLHTQGRLAHSRLKPRTSTNEHYNCVLHSSPVRLKHCYTVERRSLPAPLRFSLLLVSIQDARRPCAQCLCAYHLIILLMYRMVAVCCMPAYHRVSTQRVSSACHDGRRPKGCGLFGAGQ